MQKNWIVTGCSTGLGREIALAALRNGDRVAVTARRPDSLRQIVDLYPTASLAQSLDVTDPAQIRRVVAQTSEAFGRVDVLVNNAGYCQLGAIEEMDDGEARSIFETNFFGPLNLIREVLPQMRERRTGRILNIGSVGAFNPRSGAGVYSASKAALDSATEALVSEVGPLGIKVIIAVVGSLRTQIAESMTYAAHVIDAYRDNAHRTRQHFRDVSLRQAGDPARVAEVLVGMINEEAPRLRVPLGPGAVERIRIRLESVARDTDAGEEISAGVVFGA